MGKNIKTYPSNVKQDVKKAVAAEIYGNRFHADQTIYEYLIEFLLIFVSAGDEGASPKEPLSFHNPDAVGNLYYKVQPRIGLKRFIFFDKNKKNDALKIDRIAYDKMMKALINRIQDCEDDEKKAILESLQDLLHGYAVVLKKRTWCAQAMLPLCPELIFCEAMPAKRKRSNIVWYEDCPDETKAKKEKELIDSEFDFDKRNFLARGGELYYLHILQGLQGNMEKKKLLEWLFREQLVERGRKMSIIANFVQETWEECMGYTEHPTERLSMSYIPEAAYNNISEYSVNELINYMSCRMHPVKKIELLSKGVMLQIMRMLSVGTTNYLKQERECWIMDIGGSSGNALKRIAAGNFSNIQGDFTSAIGMCIEEDDTLERIKRIRKARKDSFDIFRSKGKELQCIIPKSGPYERFTMPEDCLRFLVLALIRPQEKMTVDKFLDVLYERYRIIIGPVQYKRMKGADIALANSFNENVNAFQEFLKSTGFLRELSDATSIVVNPYEELRGEE